jgi:hypothetical protein
MFGIQPRGMIMKQFSLATIPLLCAAITPLCADNVDDMISQNDENGNNSSSQMSDRNQHQKKKTDSQKQFEQRWHNNQITPMAHPKPDGTFNPYITADFIWWKAYEEGLSFAWDGAPLAPTAVPPDATPGEMFRPKFKWEPGFKVGLGNKFAHDGWDLYAQYTWLRSNSSRNDNDDDCCERESDNIIAWSNYWLPTNVGPEAVLMGEEYAKWNLHFNVLDLELGRNYYISKYLTLRPFAGMKFSWMKQKYKVNYSDIIFVQDENDSVSSNVVIPDGSNIKLNFDQKEIGVGLRAGMNSAWYFCKWLGAYGDFALSGLWNRFKEHRTDEINTPSATEYLSFDIKDKIYDVTAVLELGIGVFFEWAFSNDAYMLQLAVGWEDQVWFNQNQFIFVENTNAPGNLAFQGLTVRAEFAF